ncbi:aminopeptidase [Lysobacter niastensis]|uniref:Aminopeptidase n=1 Tax=Lysobacter niastensis TaxID=380629 RepID=A0ABS0B550_9GAMM|nr:aminopeptidase [Lysobacter niastensis]MBF6023905.1 aminopeptidase [Lysobacter niastensis]
MTRSLLAAALAAAVCTILAGCQRSSDDTAPVAAAPAAPAAPAEPAQAAASATEAVKAPTDLEQLAERLVTQSAGVKEGEVVLIYGRQHDAELLEDIAVNVRKVGAFPWVGYSSDRMSRRMFFDVPEKYDTQTSALAMKMAGIADVVISLGNMTTENLFEGADPKRMAARAKADEAVSQAFLKNNVRTVEIGNEMYPTSWRAQRFGMSQDELAKVFWNGVNIDYSQLQTRGEQIKSAIAAGNELHVTNANGTDLKLRVQGRRVLVSDGIISEADRKAGGPALAAFLPAGEVYTTPVPGSAEGKVVHTRSYFRGKQIDNLTLTISGGKVTAISGGGAGYEDFKADYDAVADDRKNQVSFIDFGINPNVKLPTSSPIGAWMPAGSVAVGFGGNSWAGGENTLSYGHAVFLPGSTVTLDGKPIVEKGELKL